MRRVFTLLLIVLLPTLLVGQVNQTIQNSPIVFRGVTVIDVTGAPSKSDMTVIITDNLISAIGKAERFACRKTHR